MRSWVGWACTIPKLEQSGSAHRLWSEDCSAVWWARENLIIAVADGVSNASRGGEAATLAISCLQQATLLTQPGGDLNSYARDVATDVRARFVGSIRSISEDLQQWSTTLAFAILSPIAGVEIVSIGNSEVAVRWRDWPSSIDDLALLVETSSEGHPACLHEDNEPIFRSLKGGDVDSVLLCSDGLAGFAGLDSEGIRRLDPEIGQLVSFVSAQRYPEVYAGLTEMSVELAGHDARWRSDDIGLAVATRPKTSS